MTREEKEKLIGHLKYSMEIGADYLITDEDAVEIIKALEQEPKTGWIPVSEKLPIESDYYLATIKESSGEKVVRSVWYDGEWKFMSIVQNVIAWQPLSPCYEPKERSRNNEYVW